MRGADGLRLRASTVRSRPQQTYTEDGCEERPPEMNRDDFLQLVNEALSTIPERFRDAMQNIAIVVEDVPTVEQLSEVGIEPPDTLLGLYEGTPLTERQWSDGNRLPDKITLFQGPIEEASADEDDLVVAIGETLIHEIGHYFGLSEEEIEEIEQNYWNNETDEEPALEPDQS
jgi:predicted Zn-dependent protease with MMP-like domain